MGSPAREVPGEGNSHVLLAHMVFFMRTHCQQWPKLNSVFTPSPLFFHLSPWQNLHLPHPWSSTDKASFLFSLKIPSPLLSVLWIHPSSPSLLQVSPNHINFPQPMWKMLPEPPHPCSPPGHLVSKGDRGWAGQGRGRWGEGGGTTGTLPMGFDGSADNDGNIACGTGRAELQGAPRGYCQGVGNGTFLDPGHGTRHVSLLLDQGTQLVTETWSDSRLL